jgi:hypothetical protein
VAGKWQVSASSSGGTEHSLELNLSVQGGQVSGTITSEGGTAPILDPKLDGAALTFQFSAGGNTYDVKLNRVEDKWNGTYTGGGDKGTVTARR